MSTVINTNLASLFAQNSLSNAQNNLATSVQRLSSGLRINSAKDDAAGLAISQNMQSQLNGTNQSIQNLNNATNLLQTADTSLSTIQDMLLRMKQLSTQGYDGSLNATQMQDVVQQMSQLNSEINSTAQRTQFNGISLVASSSKVDNVNAGIYGGQYLTFTPATISSVASSTGSGVMGSGVTSVTASGSSLNTGSTNMYAATYNLQLTNDNLVRQNPGTYTFRSVGDQLTLSYTGADNVPKSQTVTVEAAPADTNATKNHIQHLNFDQFGIQLDLNTTASAGSSGVLASDIAHLYQGKTFTVAGQASQITDVSLQGATAGTYTFKTNPGVISQVTTAATSSSVAGTSTVTFNALNAGDYVTVGGLTYTATANMTNDQVAAAFANLANGSITGSGTATGTYSGQLSGASTGGVSNTSQVTVTNAANGNGTYVNQTTTAGVVSSSSYGTAAVTFQAMYANDTYTVAGLTLTANQTMTAAQVATAFANLSNGATTGNATALGTWSGTLTNATTGAVSGTSDVTATRTVLDTGNPTVTRNGAATAPITQGTNNLVAQWVDANGVNHSDSISLQSSDFTLGSDTTISFKDAGISLKIHNYQAQTGAQVATLIAGLKDPLGGNTGILRVVNPGSSSLDFQSGPSSASFITINTLNVMTGVNGVTAGSAVPMTSVGTSMDALNGLNGSTLTPDWQNAFKAASSAIDGAIDYISTQRSVFGSQMNRLSYVSTNLTAQSTNLQSSRSAIVDTNFASETATLTKGQIMQQAATAMLAQANQMPNVILSLLK